jgi:hypothetical protein
VSRELSIDVQGSAIERARADLVVVPLFDDERPLQGGVGRVDWRLCGQLSSLVASGRLSGTPGEAALMLAFGGLAAQRLLVLGAGRRSAFDRKALAALARDAAGRAAALGVESVALPLPVESAGDAGLVLGAAASALGEARGDVALRLLLLVPCEEVVRTTDLLRRGGLRGVPSHVVVRLPAAGAGPTPRPTRAGASAPRGSQLVK